MTNIDIHCDSVTLDVGDFKKLVNGRFKTFKCTSCDGNGWYWVHENGYRQTPKDGDDMDQFDKTPCDYDDEDCGGVGFRIVFDE